MLIGAGFVAWFVLVLLFTPRIDYRVTVPLRPDSDEFVRVIQSTCQAAIHHQNKVEIFTNGAQFYPAMRDAIRGRASVDQSRSVYLPARRRRRHAARGDDQRASAGVEVRVVLDSIGSSRLATAPRGASVAGLPRGLLSADDVVPAAPVQQPHAPRAARRRRAHRLHRGRRRRRLVVKPTRGPTWRDTMARIEGPIVAALQGVFAENWLECCGEILTGPRHWPVLEPAGPAEALLVKSSPSDRATVVARRVPDVDRGSSGVDRHHHAVFPARPLIAQGAGARGAARRAGPGDRARAGTPISIWSGWPAGACTASSSPAASASSNTGRR